MQEDNRQGEDPNPVAADAQSGTSRAADAGHPIARYLVTAIGGALAILSVAGFAVSFVSYQMVFRAIFGAAPVAGEVVSDAGTLARNLPDILFRLRFCAAGFAVGALLVGLFRHRFREWIEESVLPLPGFLAGAARSFTDGLKSDGKLNVALLSAFCVLGLALRVRFLFRPVSFDEADTLISYASRPLYLGLSWYPYPNNHLFHTFFLHFSWLLFGDAEWAIRIPALCAGIVLIPVTYWAARSLYDKRVALMSAGLVSTASSLVYYSVNGRGYTMLCVLFLLLVIVSQYLLDHDSRTGWFVWALVAALGFYTIPTMLYAAGAVGLWMLMSFPAMADAGRRRVFLARLATGFAAMAVWTTLFYLPVLMVSGWRPLFANPFVAPKSFAYFFENFPVRLAETWTLMTRDLSGPVLWILVISFAAGLVFHRRVARVRTPLLLAAVLWSLPVVTLQRVAPFARVWIFLLPLCLMAACAGLALPITFLARGRGTRLSGSSAAVAVGAFLLVGTATLHGQLVGSRSVSSRLDDVALWMRGRLGPGDVILGQMPSTAPLRYYFKRDGIRLVSQPAPCDGSSAMYTATGSFNPRQAKAGTRILAVVDAGREQTPQSVLAIACFDSSSTAPLSLVYGDSQVKLYETHLSQPAGSDSEPRQVDPDEPAGE